eukprot:c5183_g1_i1 orf=597-884(-)
MDFIISSTPNKKQFSSSNHGSRPFASLTTTFCFLLIYARLVSQTSTDMRHFAFNRAFATCYGLGLPSRVLVSPMPVCNSGLASFDCSLQMMCLAR